MKFEDGEVPTLGELSLNYPKSKTKHRCNADLHTVVGFSQFYRIVSRNFTRSVNWPALLFILVPLVETELAENITLVMEPPEKNFNPTTAYIYA